MVAALQTLGFALHVLHLLPIVSLQEGAVPSMPHGVEEAIGALQPHTLFVWETNVPAVAACARLLTISRPSHVPTWYEARVSKKSAMSVVRACATGWQMQT